jgi:hypothetical protein
MTESSGAETPQRPRSGRGSCRLGLFEPVAEMGGRLFGTVKLRRQVLIKPYILRAERSELNASTPTFVISAKAALISGAPSSAMRWAIFVTISAPRHRLVVQGRQRLGGALDRAVDIEALGNLHAGHAHILGLALVAGTPRAATAIAHPHVLIK